MKYHQKKKSRAKELAEEHIRELFAQAQKNAKQNPERAKHYVVMARKISSRLKVPIPLSLKRSFCKACNTYWTGANVRVRLNNGKKTYVCKVCNAIKRVPYR